MGFIDDMEEIMKSIPEERQTLLFSATMPPQIKKLSKKYLKEDAQHIVIARKEMTGSTIKQNFFEVNGSQRLEALCRLIDFDNPSAGIIFCRTKKGVDDLVAAMQARGYMVEGMHGDMSQIQRMKTLAKFKNGSLKFLVATDVAARGIDVDGVTHVFNYELPQDIESYVHRIGRTGRKDSYGKAITIFTDKDDKYINEIEAYLGYEIKVLEELKIDDIAKGKIKFEKKSKEVLKNRKNKMIEKNIHSEVTKIYINAGKKKKIRVIDIVGAFSNLPGINNEDIGVVEVQDLCSYVDILNYKGEELVKKYKEISIKKKIVKLRKDRQS